MAKKKEAPNHVVGENDKCVRCLRHGAELEAPCPGYKTAAEYVDWKRTRDVKPKKGRK